MESILDLNIAAIYTVIYKKETAPFRFDNPCRAWDGFVLFTDGAGTFTGPDGEDVAFTPGTLLLLRKYDRYRIFSPGGCSYVATAYDLSGVYAEESDVLPRVTVCPENLYGDVVNMAKKWQRQQWDSHLHCRAVLLRLYLELLRSHKQPTHSQIDPTVSAAIEYLHRHFKRNFSTQEIADHCSISPSYLRARFLAQTGKTITAYREDLRIRAAGEMLQSGLFSVKETALELGYCDVYYFSRCFARHTGIPPAKFAGLHASE